MKLRHISFANNNPKAIVTLACWHQKPVRLCHCYSANIQHTYFDIFEGN